MIDLLVQLTLTSVVIDVVVLNESLAIPLIHVSFLGGIAEKRTLQKIFHVTKLHVA